MISSCQKAERPLTSLSSFGPIRKWWLWLWSNVLSTVDLGGLKCAVGAAGLVKINYYQFNFETLVLLP